MTLCALLALALVSAAPAPPANAPASPAASAHVEELALQDVYRRPVGPYGLEPTERLLSLAGHRVRVRGYIVLEEEPLPGLFMLTPVPTALAELADGAANYLPPATVYVHLPAMLQRRVVEHTPGVWDVVGTLELGAQQEANGNVSYVRLRVDDMNSVKAPDGRAATPADAGEAPRPTRHD